MFGTPAYMSPEQVKGQGNVDHRADLWALGCMTYECLTGRPVWNTDQGVAMTFAAIAAAQLPVPEPHAAGPAARVRRLVQEGARARPQQALPDGEGARRRAGARRSAPRPSRSSTSARRARSSSTRSRRTPRRSPRLEERAASSQRGAAPEADAAGRLRADDTVKVGERAARPPGLARSRAQRDRSAADRRARGAAAVAGAPGPQLARASPSRAVVLARRRGGGLVRLREGAPPDRRRARRDARARRSRRRSASASASDSASAPPPPPEMPKWMTHHRGGPGSSSRRATPTARCASSRTPRTRARAAWRKSFLDQVKLGAATTGPCKMVAFSHPRLGYGGNLGRPAVAVTSKGAVVAWTDDHEQPGPRPRLLGPHRRGGPAHLARRATSRPRPTTRCVRSCSAVDDRVVLLFWDKSGREPGVKRPLARRRRPHRRDEQRRRRAEAGPLLAGDGPRARRDASGSRGSRTPTRKATTSSSGTSTPTSSRIGAEVRATDYEAEKGKSPQVSVAEHRRVGRERLSSRTRSSRTSSTSSSACASRSRRRTSRRACRARRRRAAQLGEVDGVERGQGRRRLPGDRVHARTRASSSGTRSRRARRRRSSIR